MASQRKTVTFAQILAAPGSPADAAGGMVAPTSGAVTPQGTTGSTTCTYKLVSVSAAGKRSLGTANITTATANATQTGVNKNHITWVDDPAAATIEVYRTAGGADQGYIGSVAAGVQVFDDTGIAKAVSPVLPVATTRKYKFVALGVAKLNGTIRRSVASSEASAATGPETLSADTPMHCSWAAVTGATGYQVWRTDTLVTKGLVATVAAGVLAFNDPGTVGDGNDPPTVDETGISETIDVGEMETKYLQVGGSFSGTIQPQGTINGTDWVDEGAAITSAGIQAVVPSYLLMRFKNTAYTSGAPTIDMMGRRLQ